MNNKLTDITFLLDRSGSMVSIADDVVGGIDQFIQEQKKAPGKANFTLIQFDGRDSQEVVLSSKDITLIEGFTAEQFSPRGSTPLLDALGQCIVETGERFEKMAEADRPGTVQMVIFTDGDENASEEYTIAKIKPMVEKQTNEFNWHFLFLGANIDSFSAGLSYGIAHGSTSNVGDGRVTDALLDYSAKTSRTRMRSAGGQAVNSSMLQYTAEEQADLEKSK